MKTKKKAKSQLKLWLIPCLILFASILFCYFFQVTYYKDHFLPKTVSEKVTISELDLKQADEALTQAFNSDQFTLMDKKQVWKKVPKADLGVEPNYRKALKKALDKQNPWLWFTPYFKKPKDLAISEAAVNQTKLNQYLEQIKPEITKLNDGRSVTANATIQKKDTGFEIIPEKIGDTLDVNAVLNGIKTAVTKGEHSVELENFRAQAKITSKSPEIQETFTKINQIVNEKAQYVINGQTIDIPKETLSSWLQYDGKKDVTIDKNAVKSYVTSLGEKYNTSKVSTAFKSTKRGEVKVPAGTYSWTIQTDEETEALAKAVLAAKDFSRSPITEGSAKPDTPLIGNTYIEVDLQNQHMWYYKDGAVQLETDIVSGKPSTPTPSGVFYVWNKERNATLVGENYRTPVAYWMPIDWTGVGLHDSPWQAAYGGDRHLNFGSHGCVNTPPDVIAKLFDMVEVGVPVVIF